MQLRAQNGLSTTAMARSSLGKLVASTDDGPGTGLFICDVQERFRDTIVGYPAVIDTAVRLVRASSALWASAN